MRQNRSTRAEDFEAHFREHYPAVVASLTMIFGDPELARDSAAEAFAKALSRWRTVSRGPSPSGWTYTVALNNARRAVRRRGHEARLLARQWPVPPVVDEDGAGVWELVQELPDRQRIAAILRYADDLTEREIAEIMGVSRSTVSSLLASARVTIAGLIDDPDPSDDLPNYSQIREKHA